ALVLEREVERQLLADPLIDADVLQDAGFRTGGERPLGHRQLAVLLLRERRSSGQRETGEDERRGTGHHCFSPPGFWFWSPALAGVDAGMLRPPLDSPVA